MHQFAGLQKRCDLCGADRGPCHRRSWPSLCKAECCLRNFENLSRKRIPGDLSLIEADPAAAGLLIKLFDAAVLQAPSNRRLSDSTRDIMVLGGTTWPLAREEGKEYSQPLANIFPEAFVSKSGEWDREGLLRTLAKVPCILELFRNGQVEEILEKIDSRLPA